jgi:peroxiredoxin Q/BCP
LIDVFIKFGKVDLNSPIKTNCMEVAVMTLEGIKAPDFTLEGSDGKLHSLKVYIGRTVIIFFYPKDNTSGCTKEACGFRDGYGQLASRNIVLIGISRDSIASHVKFINNHRLPFPLLSDPDTTMMAAYGAFGEKIMYGKKSSGTIRSTVVIGPDGIIKKHWTKVAKAEEHPAQVFEYIKAAQT